MADDDDDIVEGEETPENPPGDDKAAKAEGGDDDMAAAMAAEAEGGDDDMAAAMAADAAGDEDKMGLENLGTEGGLPDESEQGEVHGAIELEPVFDVPVTVQAVLGKSYLEVSQLLKLGPGAVVELDRKVGEAIDIYVNDRLVARGEIVLIDENLGVTMTEIIKSDRT
jgi:flagellar motor switch protein FliN